MQTLSPMNSSLTHTLKVFISPMGSKESASNRTFFACGLLAQWTATLFTHNQGTSSPHGQQRLPIPSRFLSPPMGSKKVRQIGPFLYVVSWPNEQQPYSTQSRNLFPSWAVEKNVSSKVKGHWPGFDSIVTKTTETKSGDHWEITHGMVLKQLTGYITLKHIVHIQVV